MYLKFSAHAYFRTRNSNRNPFLIKISLKFLEILIKFGASVLLSSNVSMLAADVQDAVFLVIINIASMDRQNVLIR